MEFSDRVTVGLGASAATIFVVGLLAGWAGIEIIPGLANLPTNAPLFLVAYAVLAVYVVVKFINSRYGSPY